MKRSVRRKVEAAGWRVGDSSEFLGLTADETALVALKLSLAAEFRRRRESAALTQVQAAAMLESSQSRIAKMESADGTVSLDLLVRGLLRLGITPRELGRVVAAAGRRAA